MKRIRDPFSSHPKRGPKEGPKSQWVEKGEERVKNTRQEGTMGRLARLGLGLTRLTERWVPDSWIIAVVLTLTVAMLALTIGGATPGGSRRLGQRIVGPAGADDAVYTDDGGIVCLCGLTTAQTLPGMASFTSRP